MKVLLIGNPNVGKSVVFNRLTGASVLSSNYPGTTIEYTSGIMRVGGEKVEVIDVPGTYSLVPTSPAEEAAVDMAGKVTDEDVIVLVLDSTNLERSLNLALQVLALGKPTVVSLNFWDETGHTGVKIDVAKLEEILGVPCVPTTAITGEGIKSLVDALPHAGKSKVRIKEKDRWAEVGRIIARVQEVSHRHHTFGEWLGDLTVRPLTGLPLSLLVLAGMFFVIWYTGESVKSYVFDPLFENYYRPVVERISTALTPVEGTERLHLIGLKDLAQAEEIENKLVEARVADRTSVSFENSSAVLGGKVDLYRAVVLIENESVGVEVDRGFVHDILVGEVIKDDEAEVIAIDFEGSMGLITTGIYIPIAIVFSYVFVFYLVVSFLEDCGYLPRLAVLMDTVMHRLGMHGMSIVPMLLGMGCNVPGVLAARIMESRKQRFIATLLMAICVPCMAQTALIITLAEDAGPGAILMILGTLVFVWLFLGRLFKRFVHGESPEILIDIPPYRFPYLKGLLKKHYIRMKWFLKEALPFVLLGVLVVNVLKVLGVIEFAGTVAAPVVENWLGLPKESVAGLIIGFLRKDVAVGMLQPLDMTFRQVVVASVVLTMYFPCVATFAVMFREFGLKDMLKAAAIMVIAALTVGGALNFALGLFA